MLVALLTKLNKTRISEKLCNMTELTSFCLLLNDLVICSQFNVPKYQLLCTLVSLPSSALPVVSYCTLLILCY